MAASHADTVLRHIRRLVATGQTVRQTDAELLEQFALHHDQAAFAALVHRHGPLVLGVCRRILHNSHDAEDALQAAFLVLARKARSISKPESVGSWLYQVAYRVAIRARARAANRQQHERQVGKQSLADPLAEVTGRELLAVLDEELHQLPPCHRTPLVLCYLEGRTRDQAARQLGWSLRRLKHRLEQARERLRARLAGRGVALPALLLAAGLSEGAAQAALPARVVNATIQTALAAGSGSAGVAGAAATSVLILADSELATMTFPLIKISAALLLALSMAILGAAVVRQQAPGKGKARADTPKQSAKRPARPDSIPASKAARKVGKAGADTLSVTGRVLNASGKLLPGAEAALIGLPRDTTHHGLWLLDKKLLTRTKADAAGQFRLIVARTALALYERVYILASAAGHGLVWQEVSRGAGQPGVVVRLPEEKMIRGRLRDLQGQPAAGVRVRVAWLGSGLSGGTTEIRLGDLPQRTRLWPVPSVTDKNGKFAIRGLNPALHGYVFIEAERFAPHYVAIKAGATTKVQEVNMGLAPAQLIEGVVTAADTGKPLAGARVSVNSDQNPDAPQAMGSGVDSRADARGRFRLNPPSGKLFTVRANVGADKPYLNVETTFKWPLGAIRREVNLVLPRGVLIRGKLTEADSGKPVAGAVVRDTKGLWINPTVATRADGSFQIAVAPGRGHLLVKGPGNDFIPLDMTWGELEGGKPSGGRFYPDALVPFDLKPGAAVKEVAARVRRGVTIRGRLLGPGGKPPREALLLCWNQVPKYAPTWFAAAVNVSDGRFELRGCDPTRTYTVYFLDPRNQQGATVRLSAKKAGGKPVTIHLAPCGSAEGRFLDKDGKPRLDFRPHFYFYIIVRPGAPEAQKGPSADRDFVANVDRLHYGENSGTVDSRGRCRFPALIPGATYRILDLNFKSVKDFTVKPGEKLQLGDLVIGRKE